MKKKQKIFSEEILKVINELKNISSENDTTVHLKRSIDRVVQNLECLLNEQLDDKRQSKSELIVNLITLLKMLKEFSEFLFCNLYRKGFIIYGLENKGRDEIKDYSCL